MKITIDDENKTIQIEEDVNLFDFKEFISKILPDTWQDYKIKVTTNYVQGPSLDWGRLYPQQPVFPEPYFPSYPNEPVPGRPDIFYYTSLSNGNVKN